MTQQCLERAICEDFGREYGVQYNPTKTVCILYSRKSLREKPKITMCDTEIKWVNKVKHIGNYLRSDMKESTDVDYKKGDLIQRTNSLIVSVSRGAADRVLRKAFNTQCAHLYGTPVWNFSDKSVQNFQITWNKCVRRLFQLPYTTHTRFLPLVLDTSLVMDQIYGRFLKLVNVMCYSRNVSIKFLANFCVQSPRSIIGSNLRVIQSRLNLDSLDELCNGRSHYLLRQLYISLTAQNRM